MDINQHFCILYDMFKLQSTFKPAGDQPQAIKEIVESYARGDNQVTLLWATGTWKTFSMANVIQQVNKPTLILSHNKTLAAQLATEFKYFFPDNAVHYFVSYFDYYQPESYIPEKGTYIEKEATINQEIQMYRLSTMASLLSRPDTIVVSSVSALYGVWRKEFFAENSIQFEVGKEYSFDDIKARLLAMQYSPVQAKVEQWMFDIQWETIDIYVSTEQTMYRLVFNFDELEAIYVKNALTFEPLGTKNKVLIRPATQYLQDLDNLEGILASIEKEMEARVAHFEASDDLVEAQRLKKRVSYDLRMIKETGFVTGIENYSPYFEKRLDGAPPNTLFDYFPDDFLCIIDESHMTVGQIWGMPRADATRKATLVEHGFRLPSALHHRPIQFEELEAMMKRKPFNAELLHPDVKSHIKPDAKTLFVSATPAAYEIEHSKRIAQQVIRPTWLLDPITYVYPKSWEYAPVIASIDNLPADSKSLFTTPYSKDHVEKF